MEPDKIAFLQTIFPFIAIMAALGIGGWVLTTWLRIKNGYPLDGAWGQAVYPKKNDEAMERIATDPAERTAREIENLR